MGIVKKILKTILLLSLVCLVIAYLKKDSFPDKNDILEDLHNAPLQTPTYQEPFEITVENIVYTIKPVYDYELYGMVVSYHYCGTWWDMYHHDLWKDFINIKDLCVVWGENIETEVYKEMEFSSNSWTCNYRWPNREVRSRFCRVCLSNNHILCNDKFLTDRLMNTEVGDQIYIKGVLAEYSHSNNTFSRGTSTNRKDTGNGACETIYIEDYQILRKANPLWRTVYSVSKFSIGFSIFLFIAIFLIRFFAPNTRAK